MLLFLKDNSHLCFIVFGARTHSSSQQKRPPGWALKYIIITTYSWVRCPGMTGQHLCWVPGVSEPNENHNLACDQVGPFGCSEKQPAQTPGDQESLGWWGEPYSTPHCF